MLFVVKRMAEETLREDEANLLGIENVLQQFIKAGASLKAIVHSEYLEDGRLKIQAIWEEEVDTLS